ncbi:tetratricopeptide repeat protein [Erythrobacter alti]|uniref:tetratricopeptide repeat protein n=1 Tax=Erythrobacter alti TaxID=1896145 RepID=UPI0030F3FDAB
MKKLHSATLCLAFLATAGCQSFPLNFGLHDRAVEPASADMSSYFAQRLNDGRRHLQANRPGAALTAFRQASYHQDYAGEAYNGMAISYDRIGRYDLAEQLFARAVETAPDDTRFARNAARFEATMLARRGETAEVQLAEKVEEPAAQTAPVNLAVAAQALDAEVGPMPEERLQRVSNREVRIASRDEWTSRVLGFAQARPAVLHIQGGSFAALDPAHEEPPYPVRIAMTSVPVTQIVTDRTASHPAANSHFVGNGGAVRVRVSGELRPQEQAAYPIRMAIDSRR